MISESEEHPTIPSVESAVLQNKANMMAVQQWAFIMLGLSGLSEGSSNTPTLYGPGFDCLSAFDEEVLTLETLLLCNKTSTGPGFNKTEIQTLDTAVIQLEGGNCEQFFASGYR